VAGEQSSLQDGSHNCGKDNRGSSTRQDLFPQATAPTRGIWSTGQKMEGDQ
jgi:hypothetical protein